MVNQCDIGSGRVLPLRKEIIARSQTCSDLTAATISVQLKLSLLSSSETEPACFRIETTYARSFFVKKRTVSGERGRRKKDITPKTMVKIPSCQDQ